MIEAFAAAPSPADAILLEHFHGAATRLAPDATAYPHRREGYNFATLSEWMDPDLSDRCVAWARATYEAMTSHFASARYMNYMGDDEPAAEVGAAYGPNLPRLRRLKARYDPENLFHLNQNIRPAEPRQAKQPQQANSRGTPLTYRRLLMYCPAMATTTLHNEALLQRFQAVAEETRFRIVRLLAEGERCVCEIQDELDAAQSRLSFHLKKLREAGVVADRRDGRWVYYSLVPEALEEMRTFLGEVRPRDGWLPVVRNEEPCCG